MRAVASKSPTGRVRRETLPAKHLVPPKYQAVAEEAMRFWREGLPIQEIAQNVGCDKATISKAIRHWHVSQNLPVPDGRTRRVRLEREGGTLGASGEPPATP